MKFNRIWILQCSTMFTRMEPVWLVHLGLWRFFGYKRLPWFIALLSGLQLISHCGKDFASRVKDNNEAKPNFWLQRTTRTTTWKCSSLAKASAQDSLNSERQDRSCKIVVETPQNFSEAKRSSDRAALPIPPSQSLLRGPSILSHNATNFKHFTGLAEGQGTKKIKKHIQYYTISIISQSINSSIKLPRNARCSLWIFLWLQRLSRPDSISVWVNICVSDTNHLNFQVG